MEVKRKSSVTQCTTQKIHLVDPTQNEINELFKMNREQKSKNEANAKKKQHEFST